MIFSARNLSRNPRPTADNQPGDNRVSLAFRRIVEKTRLGCARRRTLCAIGYDTGDSRKISNTLVHARMPAPRSRDQIRTFFFLASFIAHEIYYIIQQTRSRRAYVFAPSIAEKEQQISPFSSLVTESSRDRLERKGIVFLPLRTGDTRLVRDGTPRKIAVSSQDSSPSARQR